ncbi:HDOD domain-containing protein [Lysinibacillus yapensis]|uniref:HDOD domain-containing protein n=1 Tax=Ureibacillus yapensis TaxID=2304605 RepID=A0A396SEI9_9BACL|nr:HDOD domain-containing protein [Lysinibacillus yapensis]RHW36632.1 HDOD domain-containing protein [Lysinibacillus yapensis]
MDVFLGRQPIFNITEEIVAYELLYRNGDLNIFDNSAKDSATLDVLVNFLLSMGSDEVTKGRPGFVNFTENLLMDPDVLELIDPSKVVIEILEDVPITPKLVERVKELKQRNFKMALDDFILADSMVDNEELFQYIDIIKIDFLATPLLKRMKIENRVKNSFPHIELLAEKVENRNQFDVARHAGYTLFQGYFFEKPQIIKSTDIPMNTLQYFQIMLLFREEVPDLNKIAQAIERDVSLSYKLLKVINDTGYRLKKKVSSIKQAILLIGLTELRKLIYLLALREGETSNPSDLFRELMRTSLFRAKICENLAKQKFKENYSEYFLIGMFSLIDALLQRPMDVILKQLPFSEEMIRTICGKPTSMTPYLEFSIALDKLDFESIDRFAQAFNLNKDQISALYTEAHDWALTSI